VQRHEEAKGLKGLLPEEHNNVAIDQQESEDTGSGAIGFPPFCERKKNGWEHQFEGTFRQKEL
jgi:hypothetical protein